MARPTVCTKAHIGSSTATLELGKPTTRSLDLPLLPARVRIGSLVVAAKQQDQPVAIRVTEDAQENAFPTRLRPGFPLACERHAARPRIPPDDARPVAGPLSQ